MTENLNAENGTTPTDGRDDAGLTALVEAALLEIADDTTNAEPAAAAIDATIDTLKESILGELWPEERSVLTGLGPAAARSSDAAVAPAPAPPPATEEAAAPTEYVADETRDAALARAVNGMALEYEGVAPPAEWDRQFEEGEWQEWPAETAPAPAAPQPAAPPAHHPNSAYVRAAAAQAEREKAMAERLTTSAMRNRAAAAQAAADAADAVVASLPSRPN